ncbi:MAG: hypothetical protein ACOX9C_03700 [Kiritimatiellia bacterium]
MKTIALFSRFVLIVMVVAAFTDDVRANDVILRVDFNAGTSSQQAGWNQFGIPTVNTPGPISETYADLDPQWTSSGTPGQATLTLAAGADITSTTSLLARDRGAPDEGATGFSYSNVYRDFITSALNVSLWIGLSGLNPETAYNLTLHAYDNNNTRKMVFVDYTGGSPGVADSVSFTAASTFDANTPSNIYAGTLAMISDSDGNLLVRVYSTLPTSAAVISGLSLAKGVRASALSLNVDFGTDLRQVQTGFCPFMAPTGDTDGPLTASYGALNTNGCTGTVVIALAAGTNLTDTSRMLSRDRSAPSSNDGAFTYSDVYRDFVLAKDTNKPFWIGLSGLTPEARYNLTFYAYDNNNTRTMTFTDYTTGVAGASGAVSYTAGSTFDASTSNDVLSTSLKVKADATGQMLIRDMPSSGGFAIVNALRLDFLPDQGTLVTIR